MNWALVNIAIAVYALVAWFMLIDTLHPLLNREPFGVTKTGHEVAMLITSIVIGTIISLYLEIEWRITDLYLEFVEKGCIKSGEMSNYGFFVECLNTSCSLCNPSSLYGEELLFLERSAQSLVLILLITSAVLVLIAVKELRPARRSSAWRREANIACSVYGDEL